MTSATTPFSLVDFFLNDDLDNSSCIDFFIFSCLDFYFSDVLMCVMFFRVLFFLYLVSCFVVLFHVFIS